MLEGFFGSANKSFDKRFLLAYWYPTLFSLVMVVFLYSWPKDWEPIYNFFSALQTGDYSFQLIIVLASLFLTLFLAHLLQAFSRPLVQFWEGYHPQRSWDQYSNLIGGKKKYNDLVAAINDAALNKEMKFSLLHEKLFYGYSSKNPLPTKLGNVIRSAEDYALSKYGMQIIFWWPRLWLLLPDEVKEQIDDSEAPMLALINLTTQIILISIVGSLYLITQNTFTAAIITFIVGLILAFITYHSAVSQARAYGNMIRATVDIYRFELLKALHQSLPSTLSEEKKLWGTLYGWLYLDNQGGLPPYVHYEKIQ